MPYTGKVSNAGISVDTNNDGIPDGRAMTVKNGGNFATFSLTNGVLTIQPTSAGASAGGSDTQVQFNDGGTAFGGHSGLVYDKTFNSNAGKLTVANLVISGDLTVSGTTTTVNTNTVTIADNIIVLNSDATGSASANAGIEIERGDDANVQLLWDETNDQWDFDTYALGSVGKVFAAGSGAVYTFTSDTDTGVEHVGLNQLGLLVGNTRVLMVNANGVHIDPTGASGAGSNQALLVDNISIDTNTIASTNTNGNIVLAPNGTGDVQLDADTVRVGDSGADATITTNGAGNLVLNTNAGTDSGSITIEDGANNDILIIPNGTGKVGVAQATPTSTFHVGGDVTISGGLTVAGTVTTVNSTNTQVADPLITLNEGETGAGVTGNIAGIEVDRGTEPIARFVWDDSQDNWRAQVQLSAGSATYIDTNLKCTGLEATTVVSTANIYVDGDLVHDGDSDTKLAFLTDQVQLYAGNVNGIDITAGSVVINEGSADVDFRVETDNEANAFLMDASADTATFNVDVGIGTTPSSSLHVSTADNIIAKFLSTDGTAAIELADNATTNNAALTRVGQTLTLCANGGDVAFGNSIGSYNGAAPTNGQLLIGDTASGVFDKGTLTSTGGTITITNGAGTINLEAAGGSGTVDVVSNVATSRILGRTTAGTGDSEELTAAQTRTLLDFSNQAVAAIQTASSIELGASATFVAKRSVVEDVTASGLPNGFLNFDLMEDQRGKVLTNALGATTIGLPDPGASQVGDTYVFLNTGSGAVTIDRSGGLHGTAQNLNGAASNGSLPANEAVTLIYVSANAWWGIGL